MLGGADLRDLALQTQKRMSYNPSAENREIDQAIFDYWWPKRFKIPGIVAKISAPHISDEVGFTITGSKVGGRMAELRRHGLAYDAFTRPAVWRFTDLGIEEFDVD